MLTIECQVSSAMTKTTAPLVTEPNFIESMECLPVAEIPEGPEWTYEIKLDGYRLQAVRSSDETTLYSRRRNVLNRKFHYVAMALDHLPAGTVLDGELVAMGSDGRPNFSLLQNFRSATPYITYYAFDILLYKNRDLTQLPLSERRDILRSVLKPNDHVALTEVSSRSAAEMLGLVKQQGLEGVVAKRSDSIYQPGLRTGLWRKHRIRLGQEFVIGGFIPNHQGIDSLVVGFYRGNQLLCAAHVRSGFTLTTRLELFNQLKHLRTSKCPFVNLPEMANGRSGLTAARMKECVWLKPETVAQVEFLGWDDADHLRQTKFATLRDDKDPWKVVRET
jgi:DNA ligase D-like protein (predicted ligase)